MLNRLKLQLIVFFVLIVLGGFGAQAQGVTDNGWPREIETSKATIVIYQPQPESLEGNLLKGRAAVSLEFKNGDEPMFGAVWFAAKLDRDDDERLATLSELQVTDVKIPMEDEKHLALFQQVVEEEVPKWDLPISLDRLLASLETVATQSEMAEKIKHDPPQIIFMPEPAILVTIDGEPRLVSEKESSLMRVVNTPFTILLVPEEKIYYLNADPKTWYKSSEIKGEWQVAEVVPSAVAERAPKPEPADGDAEKADSDDNIQSGAAPKIVVATQPTELISSTGKPEYTPIKDTGLLYLSNSDSDVFLTIKSQESYVLLAGRWFSSKSLNGPWKFVPGEELPPDFAAIPEDSEMATVLYAVPGTDAAREAALEAQIPQTAKVDRKNATLKVEYDGKPQFETITGTRMIYATNTATPVIYVKRKYYACDEAIWFVSENPSGPWRVAESIPEDIYTIPPDNPLYNVTFVRIYSSTPEEVYVGYTPGYAHTYVYHSTVVYGTGYYYPYWYHSWYCPRPVTYGYHVRYNSWSGWSFGFSYGYSPYPFYFGHGWYYGGWWGPYRYRGYRYGYRHGYRPGYKPGHRPPGHKPGKPGNRPGNHRPRPDLYNSKKNRDRVMQPAVRPSQGQARPANRRANNVFTDHQGNIHRKNGNNWEKRTRDGWQKENRPSQRPAQKPQPGNRPTTNLPSQQPTQRPNVTRPPSTRPATQPSVRPATRPSAPATRTNNLERSSQSRQRGTQRTNNFRSQRSSQPSRSMQRSRPSSGRRR